VGGPLCLRGSASRRAGYGPSVCRALVFGVLALALVSTGAAAASTAATIPQASYVRQADRICLDVAQKALALQREARRRVGASTSDAQTFTIFGEIYRRQLTLVQLMRRRLVALGMPRTGAATARTLVDGIRDGEQALGRLIAATDARSMSEFTRAAIRYRNVSLASARAVKRSGLGFTACGAGA